MGFVPSETGLGHYDTRPKNGFRLPANQSYDVIFCHAVYEHLNDPVQTTKDFYRLLNPGGVLIFDYVMTDIDATEERFSGGLDHFKGHTDRTRVLEFMDDHFEILHGKLLKDAAISACVLRKN